MASSEGVEIGTFLSWLLQFWLFFGKGFDTVAAPESVGHGLEAGRSSNFSGVFDRRSDEFVSSAKVCLLRSKTGIGADIASPGSDTNPGKGRSFGEGEDNV